MFGSFTKIKIWRSGERLGLFLGAVTVGKVPFFGEIESSIYFLRCLLLASTILFIVLQCQFEGAHTHIYLYNKGQWFLNLTNVQRLKNCVAGI